MPRFRSLKNRIRPWLRQTDWSQEYPLPPDLFPAEKLQPLINPLFACLPEGEPVTQRAAFALGRVTGLLCEPSPEEARNVVRRFIWQMNEESGNIGWGIPEAFGETLARSRLLADTYHNILFSYIRNPETDSTYCDYAPLRRSCYLAVGRVAEAWPDLAEKACSLLQAGRTDPDESCRCIADGLLERLDKGNRNTRQNL